MKYCIDNGLIVGIVWLMTCSLIGQEDSIRQVDINPIIVTGTRIETQKNEVPASISVVHRSQIERNGSHNILSLVEQQVPGLFLNSRSVSGFGVGPNTGGNISIRGISGSPNSQVLVLIDGQPQYMGIFAHPIADAYTSSDIERVEVVRGPASILYGTNAFGGAINLITREPKNVLGIQIDASYGSFDTKRLRSSFQSNTNGWRIFGAFNYDQTDGHRSDGNDDFKNLTGYLKLGYTINENFSFQADANIADATYHHPGPTIGPLQADQRDYQRNRFSASLKNDFKKVKGALQFFLNSGDHRFSDGFNSTDINQGITFYQNLNLLKDQTITLGWDLKDYGGKAKNENLPPPVKVGFDEEHRITESDIYGLIKQKALEKLILHAGIRLAHHSILGSQWIPAFGLAIPWNEESSLKASISKSFRSPSILDLYLFPPSNPDLLPEEAWNYEVSLNKSWKNVGLHTELTAYYIKGENLIQEVIINQPPPVRQNRGDFIHKGLEYELRYTPNAHWALQTSYHYLDLVLYSPDHHLHLRCHYHRRGWSGTIHLRQVWGLQNTLEASGEKENYTILNLRLRRSIFNHTKLYLEANNLFDTTYEIDRYYPMPGVNFLLGMQVNFKK